MNKKEPKTYIGVDTAKVGEDETVFTFFDDKMFEGMTEAQKQIRNLYLDNLERGVKMVFIMPRKAGRATLRKSLRKVHQHSGFGTTGCSCE